MVDWEPGKRPGKLMAIGSATYKGPEVRPATIPPEYLVTASEWEGMLQFFGYRCAYCGDWADKLNKVEVPRLSDDFPWTDFGRDEYWTGIVVPVCERCVAKSLVAGWLKAHADSAMLELVREWLELNKHRIVYR